MAWRWDGVEGVTAPDGFQKELVYRESLGGEMECSISKHARMCLLIYTQVVLLMSKRLLLLLPPHAWSCLVVFRSNVFVSGAVLAGETHGLVGCEVTDAGVSSSANSEAHDDA